MPEKTVLIVEDEPEFAEFLEIAARSAGYQAQVARDGAEAIDLFTILEPDLVLLDLLLPKKDGFAVCAEMRAHPERGRTPVVMLTGVYRKREYLEQAQKQLGVDEFLTKPVRIVDLWRVFDRYLGSEEGRAHEDAGTGSAAEGAEPSFHGEDLAERPFGAVLGDLQRACRTGLLFLKAREFTQIFFVRDGKIVFIRSNEPGYRLGDLLLRSGRIEESQIRAAQELYDKGRGRSRLGEILVGMNLLSLEQLREILREQLRALALRAFEITEGRTAFVEVAVPEDEEACIPLEIPDLILEGVARMPGLEALRASLPPGESLLALSPAGASRLSSLSLTPTDRQVLSLVDGTKPLSRIVAIARLAHMEAERLLFGFLSAGLVEIRNELPPRRPDPRPENPGALALTVVEMAGELRVAELPRLLARLYYSRKTGVLTCQGGGRKTWLYFSRGDIVFVGSDDRPSRLGDILIDGGLVTQEEIDQALSRAPETGARIGEILVSGGLISLEELHWAVRIQMQRRIEDLFGWNEGTYRFREGPLPSEEAICLEFGTLDVVLEGVRKMPALRLGQVLPDGRTALRRSWNCSELAAALRFTPEERALLDRLSDRGTLEEFLAAAGGPPEGSRRTLYGLYAVGCIEPERVEKNVLEEIRFEMEEDEESAAPPRPEARPLPVAPAAESGPPGPAVPRFLFEQIVEERNQLEQSLLDLRRSLGEVRGELLRAREEIATLCKSSLLRSLGTEPAELIGIALADLESRLEGALRQTPEPGPAPAGPSPAVAGAAP